jgi:hypothetical protein
MAMDGDIEAIPDLKYRAFMLKLSRQITAQDLAELKYMLTSLIPDGKKEKLSTAIELFRFLEQQLFVGTNNLGDLEKLFRLMKKPILRQMVTKYTRGRDHWAIESFKEFASMVYRRIVHSFLILVRRQ